MKIKIYFDDDDGTRIGYLVLSKKKLTAILSSIVAIAIWICQG